LNYNLIKKIESQAFFGSYFKSHIEGQSMFCDYFNPQTRMYCKRLKVMCSEHEKEKKISDDEVCGYPLPNPANILEDSPNELCLAPKRSCSMHFKWEKLRRAQIDLEKLRTWLKLEELYDQKRANETALSQRRGLLSILLHQTLTDNNNNNSIPKQTTSETNDNLMQTETPQITA
jgi:COMPASS component SPP1